MLNLKVTGVFLGGCPAVVVLISCPKRLLYYIIYYLFLSVVVESLFRRLHPRIQFLTAFKKLTSWLNNMQMLKKKKKFFRLAHAFVFLGSHESFLIVFEAHVR